MALLAADFDERDPAVKALLSLAIKACRAKGKYIGICGQGPSDHPDFARWLMEQGIESMSLNPDSVIDTWQKLARRCKQRAWPHQKCFARPAANAHSRPVAGVLLFPSAQHI